MTRIPSVIRWIVTTGASGGEWDRRTRRKEGAAIACGMTFRRTGRVQGPPHVRTRPLPEGAIGLTYASPTSSCEVLPGVIEGLAAIYGERVSLDEKKCVHRGDPACEFVIRSERSGSPRNGVSRP